MALRFLPLPLAAEPGSIGAAAGVGGASGIGSHAIEIAGNADGLGVATGIGQALFLAMGEATGTGVGLATSGSDTGVGEAAGTGDAAGYYNIFEQGDGLAAGTGAALGSSGSTGLAAGTGTASAASAGTYQTVGAAAGAGNAHAFTDEHIVNNVFRLCNMDGIKLNPLSNTSTIEPEVGELLTRKRFTGDYEDISGTLRMVTRQMALDIKNFWRDDLEDGTHRFIDEHPVTREPNNFFMFLQPPTLRRHGHLYDVDILVRRLEE